MKHLSNLVLLFFLTRPIILIPVWGFSLFGYRLANDHGMVNQPFSFAHFGLLILFSISVAATYLLNQREDFSVDSDNGGYPLMVKSGISLQSVTIATTVLAIASVVLPLIFKSIPLTILSIISLAIGWLYSCKPTYFTGRPIMDFATNAIGFGGVAFAAGWFVGGGNLSFDLARSAIPYVLLMCAGSISSTLPDIEGDRMHNKITTAVKFGEDRAHIAAAFFLAGGSILGALNSDFAAVLCGVLASPFYLVHLLKPSQKSMELTYKAGGGFMMLVVAIAYPLFGIISLIVGLVTYFYFKLVHKVNYPSLLPDESKK